VVSVGFNTPLKTRLGTCIYKTLLLHRPDDYIGFTPNCPPHNLQQNCAHGCTKCYGLANNSVNKVSVTLWFCFQRCCKTFYFVGFYQPVLCRQYVLVLWTSCL